LSIDKLGICLTFFLGKNSYLTFYDFLKKPYTQFLQIQEPFKQFNDLFKRLRITMYVSPEKTLLGKKGGARNGVY